MDELLPVVLAAAEQGDLELPACERDPFEEDLSSETGRDDAPDHSQEPAPGWAESDGAWPPRS
jgi:hypothetical protein